MRTISRRGKVALACVGAATLAISAAGSASADISAQPTDAVGVGSDTLQFGTNFVVDGDAVGDGGYNSGTFNRVFDYFATGDGNGRQDGNNSNATPPGPQSSVVLRAGLPPVIRPNGSGKGVAALIADSNSSPGYEGLPGGSINYARMSRLPGDGSTAATNLGVSNEDGTCVSTTGCTSLHVYEIANDTLKVAKAATSNAPATLTSLQLYHIYACDGTASTWNQVGGTSTDTILPVVPQSGSGTRVFFYDKLNADNPTLTPLSATSLKPCVLTAQEHDPNGILTPTADGNYPGTGVAGNGEGANDAISPFSLARLDLLNNQNGVSAPSGTLNYFGNTAAPNFLPNKIVAITGAGSFTSVRGMYIVVRSPDITAPCSATTTPCFVPGGTQNVAKSLIAGTPATTVFGSAAIAPNLLAAGFTQKFQDCGTNPAFATSICATSP